MFLLFISRTFRVDFLDIGFVSLNLNGSSLSKQVNRGPIEMLLFLITVTLICNARMQPFLSATIILAFHRWS